MVWLGVGVSYHMRVDDVSAKGPKRCFLWIYSIDILCAKNFHFGAILNFSYRRIGGSSRRQLMGDWSKIDSRFTRQYSRKIRTASEHVTRHFLKNSSFSRITACEPILKPAHTLNHQSDFYGVPKHSR